MRNFDRDSAEEYLLAIQMVYGQEVVGLPKSSSYHKKLRVLYASLEKALDWATNLDDRKSYTRKQLTDECRTYLYSTINYKQVYAPSGFFEPFSWSFIVSMIVKWVVEQIIQYIIDEYALSSKSVSTEALYTFIKKNNTANS